MAEILTQGLNAWIINKEENLVHDMGCLFDIDNGSAPRSKIDVTGLCATVSKKYIGGLKDPGESTWTIKIDDTASDPFFNSLGFYEGGTTLTFVIGLAGGSVAPTVAAGVITYPSGRTFIHFTGFVSDFKVVFEKDNIVTVDIVIQQGEAASIASA